MSDKKKKLPKECVAVQFTKSWRGHTKGSDTKLSVDRAVELHANGTCKVTEQGRKVCQDKGVKLAEPKKAEPRK